MLTDDFWVFKKSQEKKSVEKPALLKENWESLYLVEVKATVVGGRQC